jgi:hypothetical protein
VITIVERRPPWSEVVGPAWSTLKIAPGSAALAAPGGEHHRRQHVVRRIVQLGERLLELLLGERARFQQPRAPRLRVPPGD